MSRQIYRVPFDFAWPRNRPWHGFINPHARACPAEGKTCFGGDTAAMAWLSSVSRLLSMLGEEAMSEPHADALRARGRIFPHPYLTEWGQAPRTEDGELVPFGGEDLVQLVAGLSGGERQHRLAGGAYSYTITKTLLKAAGLPETWGLCPVCGGEGDDPASREAAAAWNRTEPPVGPGWQLWETVTTGSPISPVLTEASFRAYLLDEGYSPESVNAFLRDGWCPTAIGRVEDGPDGPVVEFKQGIEGLSDE